MKDTVALTFNCQECGAYFEIHTDTLIQVSDGLVRCPVCGSNDLHVAITLPDDDWDGTLQERVSQAEKGEVSDASDVEDSFMDVPDNPDR